MFRRTIYPALAACGVLTACSGATVNLSTGSGAEFNALVNESQRLSDRLLLLSPTATLPTTATGATYQGVVIVADDFTTSTTGVVGTADLTAHFTTPSVTGTGTGFFQTALNASNNPTGTGSPVPGSLNFASTSFIGTAFIMDVNGTVQIDGTSRTIGDPIAGAFFGPNAEMITAGGVNVATTSPGFDVDIAVVAD